MIKPTSGMNRPWEILKGLNMINRRWNRWQRKSYTAQVTAKRLNKRKPGYQQGIQQYSTPLGLWSVRQRIFFPGFHPELFTVNRFAVVRIAGGTTLSQAVICMLKKSYEGSDKICPCSPIMEFYRRNFWTTADVFGLLSIFMLIYVLWSTYIATSWETKKSIAWMRLFTKDCWKR